MIMDRKKQKGLLRISFLMDYIPYGIKMDKRKRNILSKMVELMDYIPNGMKTDKRKKKKLINSGKKFLQKNGTKTVL